MVTKYPNAIDGYSEIRVVRDGIEEVIARDHNDNRSAIVAIEQTLGLQPQGVFGTVVARLDQADLDFVLHITGAGHRHVAGHIDYPGSLPKKFADGSVLPPSALDGVIDEIVDQLGGLSGDEKIGANVFNTVNGKFRFPAGSVSSQLQNAGDFTDEVSGILENELSGFVVQGMQVTRFSQIAVTISAGVICLRGRMRSYAGGMLIHSGIGSHMIYAVISGTGNVSILDASTYDQFVGVNGYVPTVMLQAFTENGSGWFDNNDVRRFGLYANNKPYFTVGEDGHGADFTSLQNALRYVSFLQLTTSGINRPYKIVLVSDLTHVPLSSVSIIVPPNVEIDGGGHTLSWSIDGYLFDLGTNTTLRDIKAEYTGSGIMAAGFARIAAVGAAVGGHKIIDCTQSGANARHFVRFADDGSGISDVTISGCSAAAQVSHVSSVPGTPAPQYAHVVGNRFYQTGVTVSSGQPDADVRVGGYSIVANNYIRGGFAKGIQVYTASNTAETLVSGNKIDGGTGVSGSPGSPVMASGIDGYSGCLVIGNFVKGVTSVGISCIAVTNSCVIDNFIDNSLDDDPASRASGIIDTTLSNPLPWLSDLATNNLIFGNLIVCPGTSGWGIQGASSNIIGNFILGKDALHSDGGIRLLAGAMNTVIANNVVRNVYGVGIQCGSASPPTATNLCISGNILINDYLTGGGVTNASAAITNFGSYCSVVGNFVQQYGVDRNSILVRPLPLSHDVVISQNSFILCSGTIINMGSTQRALVNNNFMVGGSEPGPAIVDYGSDSVIAHNFAYLLGGSTNSTMMSASTLSGNGLISGNTFVGCLGDAIDCYGMANQVILGNKLIGASSSSAYGIRNVGATSLVADNFVREYGVGGVSGILATGNNVLVVGNFVIQQGGTAIDLLADSYGMVVGNYISEPGIYGVLATSSNFLSICGNFINLAGDTGVFLNASRGSLVANNAIFSPAASGIVLSGASIYGNVCGNQIRGCGYGILLSATANACLVIGNMVVSHSLDAISVFDGMSGSGLHTIVGNATFLPRPAANGINLTGTSDTLLIGNRCAAGTGAIGFVIDAQPGGAGNTVTAAGNLSMDGSAPTNFSANNNIDGNSCRYI